MRSLSATLLAAQKKPDRLPYVEAKVYDFEQGIQRLHWTRLYQGSEPDGHHGLAFDGQGSLYRVRSSWDHAEYYNLYYQKITNPGPTSDFGPWTLVTSDCSGPCAIAAYGSKVYIFYRRTDNTIRKYYSHNYGVDWTDAQLSTYQNATSMAAAWWGTGNIVVCFIANGVIASGQLNAIVLDTSDQSSTEHTHSEPDNHPLLGVYGIGATFATSPERMCVIFAARQHATPYNFYALFRTELSSSYNWLGWQYFLTAPDGENINYQYPDVHLPASPESYEWFQMTAVEVFVGTTAYNRPLRCHAVRASEFSEMAYSEPKLFLNISSSYGLRLATTGSYWWMERPDGVWRAPRAAGDPLDLTQDIIELIQRIPGELTIELDNHRGQYASPGEGDISKLKKRSEVVLKLGYKTSAGDEASQAGVYWIDGWEYLSAYPNQSTFVLHCLDGWGLSDKWLARYQMRWNETAVSPKTVWQLIKALLCRWGICLCNLCNRSTAINSLQPEFIVNPGQPGDAAVRRLLAMVPDALDYQRYDANLAYTVATTKDLKSDEGSCYEYKNVPGYHHILEGEYRQAVPLSHARAIGRDASDAKVTASAFDWDNLQLAIDNFQPDYDPNLENATRAQERADAILRKHALEAMGGQITAPVNCGQELYDVITVTDERCGISSKKYRVTGMQVDYNRREARYTQRLTLTAP